MDLEKVFDSTDWGYILAVLGPIFLNRLVYSTVIPSMTMSFLTIALALRTSPLIRGLKVGSLEEKMHFTSTI